MSFAILTDVTRCIGCEQCVVACKKTNGLAASDPPPRPPSGPDDLSATRWTTVVRRPGNHFVRQQCRHCLQPACVSVCPVGALQKTPEGAIVYDKSRCMGCRYCMLSCPFGVPRYDWSSANPSVRKCVLCYDAIKSGRLEAPACVIACPQKATTFGSREALLGEAHRRLAQAPNRYIQHVWGEYEVGGSSVLLISDISLDFLGWKGSAALGNSPLPQRTWAALEDVPFEFVGMGIVMSGVYWIIERRRRLAREGEACNAAIDAAKDDHDHQ
jgi:formate dehydrogenase iron-sulfur subunit